MGGFFGDLLGVFGTVAQVAVSGSPLLGIGLAIKHAEKIPILKQTVGRITKKIPNGLIPAILPLLGGAAAPVLGIEAIGDVAANTVGALLGLGSTGVHQIAKIGIRTVVEKLAGSEPSPRAQLVQNAIGPGSRVSI